MSKLQKESEFFGDRELRWYQIATRNKTIEALNKGSKRILNVLPTGAGKTLTIACSVSHPKFKKALNVPTNRNVRVLFCCHTKRLLSQAEETFAEDSGVDIITQSIFSKIPEDVEWDVTVLDESHHEACSSFQYQLEKIGDKPLIGLTATPNRADGMMIKFDTIIEVMSRVEAVEQGYLSETSINTFIDPTSKNKVEITTDIIDNFSDQFGQTMMFFRTRDEVRQVAEHMIKNDLKAVAIIDQTPTQVDQILTDFENGEVQFLLNCSKINEGVDVKGCTDVFLGRTFGSYNQLNQVIGRASRPDSSCTVWELNNPLSSTNLDTTVIVGTPIKHKLLHKRNNVWNEDYFETNTKISAISGNKSTNNLVNMSLETLSS